MANYLFAMRRPNSIFGLIESWCLNRDYNESAFTNLVVVEGIEP